MIHEFAVEPEVMATWEHFNALWPDFGVSHGRLLVEFPGNWREKVITLADRMSKPVHAHSIKSRLLDHSLRMAKLVGPDGRSSDGPGWQRNAVAQQKGDKPFRAVVVKAGQFIRADVLVAGEFERDAEPWNVKSQDDACPRNALEMLRRICTLLKHSKKLKLVDRNFDPTEPRFCRPFESFVGVHERWELLELHTALPERFVTDALHSKYRRGLELAIPQGTTLNISLWPGLPAGDQMHPRFVLTERGGACFDYGLDEGRSQAETTLVTLLEHEVFLNKWQDFGEQGTRFGQAMRFTVEGRG